MLAAPSAKHFAIPLSADRPTTTVRKLHLQLDLAPDALQPFSSLLLQPIRATPDAATCLQFRLKAACEPKMSGFRLGAAVAPLAHRVPKRNELAGQQMTKLHHDQVEVLDDYGQTYVRSGLVRQVLADP